MKKQLAIKLARFGRKHAPFYRIAVMPSYATPSKGKILEYLGYYNPISKDFKVNEDRVKHFLSVGARMSDSVRDLIFNKTKILANSNKNTNTKKALDKHNKKSLKKS